MADILRNMADMLEKENGEKQNRLEPVNVPEPESKIDPVMIPPLQQKLEILKKTAGMNNALDSESDELDDIKKLTGIKAVIQQEAGEDNDIVG